MKGVLSCAVLGTVPCLLTGCSLLVGDGDYAVALDGGAAVLTEDAITTSDTDAQTSASAKDDSSTGPNPSMVGPDAALATADSTSEALADANLDGQSASSANPSLDGGYDVSDATTLPGTTTSDAMALTQRDADEGEAAATHPPPDGSSSGMSAEAAAPMDASSPEPDAARSDTGPGACTQCLEVFYENTTPADTSQGPEVMLELANLSLSPVNLSEVTVRYYFTADGCAVTSLAGRCDASLLRSQSAPCPSARFEPLPNPTATADTYMELSFTGVGVLPVATAPTYEGVGAYFGANFGCTFEQTNDYSYSASAPQFAPAPTITAYVNGILVWGVEP